MNLSAPTIKKYLDYLEDSFMINQAKRIEIDFVANKGSKRYYIQSAFLICFITTSLLAIEVFMACSTPQICGVRGYSWSFRLRIPP